MKNYFRKSFVMLFMALACASFAFVACGDDDDENGNGGQQNSAAQQTGLVGTWYTEGNKLVFVYPEEDNADYDVDEYIYKIAGNQLYLYELDSQTGEQELENVLTRQ